MKTLAELQALYNERLVPELSTLEEKRKQIANKLMIIGGVVLVSALLISISVWSIKEEYVFYTVILAMVICSGSYMFFTKDYRREFKASIIEKIVKFVDEGLRYSATQCIPESVFRSSEIFRIRPDRYRGEDCVEGDIDATHIKFSEIHAEYKTESYSSKGGRRTQWHTIFKGLFFVADFNKNFSGKTIVLPDTAERLFGNFGSMFQSWNKTRGELIKLEDPEFERLFVVYGDDQIEARYILSTSLMKRITEFRNRVNKQIFLSFIGSNIIVAVSYQKNCFEPRVFKTIIDFTPIQEYFEDIKLVTGIVEDLNLNLRIWGKA